MTIEFKSIWRVGPHVLACGDLADDHGLELLERFGPAQLTYTDPPWGMGAVSLFRNKVGLVAGGDFVGLMRALARAVKHTEGDVFIEMGNRWVQQTREALEGEGAEEIGQWAIEYQQRPCALLRPHWDHLPTRLFTSPAGLDDEKSPGWAMRECTNEFDIVFDPCVGLGCTARHAHRLNRRLLAMELNPERLSRTIDWLTSQGLQAEPIQGGLA